MLVGDAELETLKLTDGDVFASLGDGFFDETGHRQRVIENVRLLHEDLVRKGFSGY